MSDKSNPPEDDPKFGDQEKENLRNQFDHAREEVTREDIAYVLSKADHTAKRLEDSSQSWVQQLGKQARLLWELLSAWWKDEYELPWRVVAAITAALLYLVNPYDLFFDILPFVGWLDDAMILKFAYNLAKSDLRAYALHKGYALEEYGL